MTCQHDALLPDCTMEIQLNWQGSRIVCTECLRASALTKHGRIKDPDPPEHAVTAPETSADACMAKVRQHFDERRAVETSGGRDVQG